MFPDEAGIGQVPASAANAASERTRPGCDQAVKTRRGDHRADPGQLAQFRGGVCDGNVEGLAVVDQLTIEGNDALGQPDGFLPAGTDDGILSAVTPSGDHLELTVQQCFTRIDSQVDRAQQRGQSVDRPGPLSDHLFAGHDQHAQYHPRAGGTWPPQPGGVDGQDRASDADRVQGIGLADTATLGGGHRRRLGDKQPGIGHALGQPGTVGTDSLDDDQCRLLADPVGDPRQCAVESWRYTAIHEPGRLRAWEGP